LITGSQIDVGIIRAYLLLHDILGSIFWQEARLDVIEMPSHLSFIERGRAFAV